MSAFTDFVTLELPRRLAFLTVDITSYDGDPNHVSAPAIFADAPTGTEYQQETPSGQLWKKDPDGAWYVLGAVTLDLSAVAQNVVPDTDNARSIGTALLRWAAGYIVSVYATLIEAATVTASVALELGSVIRVKATDGAFGTPQNGDIWTDGGTFRLRDGGITIRPEVRHPATVVDGNATRLLAAADHGTTIEMTVASTVTIPAGLPVGWWCKIRQAGSGQVTFANDGTSALVALSDYTVPLKTAEQWADVVVECRATNNIKITGELEQ